MEKEKDMLDEYDFSDKIEEEELIESSFSKKSPLTYEVPQEELNIVKDVSIGFWIRFSFNNPEPVIISKMREKPVQIATVSESGQCRGEYGDRKMGIDFRAFKMGKPAYKFTTYSLSQKLPEYTKIMEIEDYKDFEGFWNYLYFGHSRE